MLNAAALLNTAPTFVGLTIFSRTAMRERAEEAFPGGQARGVRERGGDKTGVQAEDAEGSRGDV